MKVIYKGDGWDYLLLSIRNYGGGKFTAVLDGGDGTDMIEKDVMEIEFSPDQELIIGDAVQYFHNNVGRNGFVVNIGYESPFCAQFSITVYNESSNEVEVVPWGQWMIKKP